VLVLLVAIVLGPILFLFGLGFVSLGRISRISGIRYVWPGDAFRLYKYAFTTMRGSRETRNLLIGFLGAIAWVFIGFGIVWLIVGKR
jgi:hypothetical protein